MGFTQKVSKRNFVAIKQAARFGDPCRVKLVKSKPEPNKKNATRREARVDPQHRHYKKHVIYKTWASHSKVFEELDRFMAEKGLQTLSTFKDVDLWIDHILTIGGSHWPKDKVDHYRVASKHWLNANENGTGFHFDPEGWLNRWDGVWYQSKEGANIPCKGDDQTTTGDVSEPELEELLRYVSIKAHCGLRLPLDVKEALIICYYCCLRRMEFCGLEVGDFNPLSNILHLRVNKGATVRNGDTASIYQQNIPVLHPRAIQALTARQKRLRSRQNSDNPLMFRWRDIPAGEINDLVREFAASRGWSPTLHFCMHSLRHGGSQVLNELRLKSLGTDKPISMQMFAVAVHMCDSNFNQRYGVPREQRVETKARKTANAAAKKAQRR